jgi:two-component system, OmpR family, sensor histidine kinase KdpD
VGIKPVNPQDFLTLDQRTLLDGYANMAALAVERASFAEKVAQSEMLRTTEKLQTALLNSISHELRTPLASITGALTSLGESEIAQPPSVRLDSATSLELINSATQQAQRLNLLVQNLLDMTRLEAGAMRLHREPGDLLDLVNTVIQQTPDRFSNHPASLDLPPDLPLVMMDAVLVGQVLSNLLDNACKYSPAGAPIEIHAGVQDQEVQVSVTDHGIGIPPEDLERVFEKFFRVQRQYPASGTGLGLSICRGIIEAHGGQIWAQNNPAGGITVTFTLPVHKDEELAR